MVNVRKSDYKNFRTFSKIECQRLSIKKKHELEKYLAAKIINVSAVNVVTKTGQNQRYKGLKDTS